MQEKISVIVPVYNVEKYLKDAIDSILSQSYTNIEVILVNDGSTDNSLAICQQFVASDQRVQLINKENGGLSDARNVGLSYATGLYVIFIDSDDYIHPDMLESLYTQMKAVGADVSSCNVMNVYTDKQTPQCADDTLHFVYQPEAFLQAYLIGELVPGTICNKLLKMDIAKQLQFPVGKIYEDAFYHYDLIQVAKTFVVNTRPYYYYRHRENSITTQAFNQRDLVYVEVYQQFYDFVLQNYPSLQQAAFFRLAYAHFYLLDKVLLSTDNLLSEKTTLLSFLKKHIWQIVKNPHFRLTRRLASIALAIHWRLYRYLLVKDVNQNKRIETHA